MILHCDFDFETAGLWAGFSREQSHVQNSGATPAGPMNLIAMLANAFLRSPPFGKDSLPFCSLKE